MRAPPRTICVPVHKDAINISKIVKLILWHSHTHAKDTMPQYYLKLIVYGLCVCVLSFVLPHEPTCVCVCLNSTMATLKLVVFDRVFNAHL